MEHKTTYFEKVIVFFVYTMTISEIQCCIDFDYKCYLNNLFCAYFPQKKTRGYKNDENVRF